MYISADGKLRLLDYKTDRLPHDPDKAARLLTERYGEQMRTYMRAAEQIARMPLDRRLAALCDRGALELMDDKTDYLDAAVDTLVKKLGLEAK